LSYWVTARKVVIARKRPQLLKVAEMLTRSKVALIKSAPRSKKVIQIMTARNYKSALAKLAGGVAVIKAGAATEVELKSASTALKMQFAMQRLQ
jgi:hypothetical protein